MPWFATLLQKEFITPETPLGFSCICRVDFITAPPPPYPFWPLQNYKEKYSWIMPAGAMLLKLSLQVQFNFKFFKLIIFCEYITVGCNRALRVFDQTSVSSHRDEPVSSFYSWCTPSPTQPYPAPVTNCAAPTSVSWPQRWDPGPEPQQWKGPQLFAVARREPSFPWTRPPVLRLRRRHSFCFCLVRQSTRWMLAAENLQAFNDKHCWQSKFVVLLFLYPTLSLRRFTCSPCFRMVLLWKKCLPTSF